MFIDATKRSKGHVLVFADQRGSYGEVVNVQVGKMYASVQSAFAAANALKAKGTRGVYIRNLNTNWRMTITP